MSFLSKQLIRSNIYFDELYITGPTGDQYEGVECYKDKANVEFIKDVKQLPYPDQLPKLVMFDDVRANESFIDEYFCKIRHNNRNMIYLNQSQFSLDRQNVGANSNLSVLFEQRGEDHM